MPTLRVNQIRSGEGWILTDPSNIGPEVLATDLADLLGGTLLVASEDFESWTPPGGEQLEAHLFAFRGDAAKAMLKNMRPWAGRRAIFACVPALPGSDAKRRWMPDALRPWDPERLKATVYGQAGKDWAQQGLWFATERDRARYLELSVRRVLDQAGVRMPNGDVTIVLEMPTDSTFEARFDVSGQGESLRLRRDFPSQMMSREWSIRRGSWEALERKSAPSSGWDLKKRLTQGLVSAGIVVMSIPVFFMVVLVAIIARLTGASTTVSRSAKSTAE